LFTGLLKYAVNQSKDDYSLFTKQNNGKSIAVLVYVEAMILTGNDIEEIIQLKRYLHIRSHMKDLRS